MSPVTWLNERDLILVSEVQRFGVIRSDREMERGSVDLRDRCKLRYARIFLGNQLRPAEPELCVADVPSWNEH